MIVCPLCSKAHTAGYCSFTVPAQSENVTGADALDNLPMPPMVDGSPYQCASCGTRVRSLCKKCGHDPRPRVSVAVCLVKKPGVVLMVRHKERGWEFPVGKVEPEELLDVAASRELREETGVHVEPHHFRFVGLMQLRGRSFGHWLNHLFAVDYDTCQPITTGDVVDQALDGLEWFTWEILDTMVVGSCPRDNDGDGNCDRHPDACPSGISRTAHMIVNNARRSRELRDPGYATHCARCLREIPCHCMRGLQ